MDEGIGKGVESQKTLLLQSCGQTRCLILIIQIDLESRCDPGFLLKSEVTWDGSA